MSAPQHWLGTLRALFPKRRARVIVENLPLEFIDELAHLPTPINITQALKRMREVGRSEAMRQRLPVVYLASCPRHQIPLHEDSAPGTYFCFLCQLEAQPPVQTPYQDVQRVTEPTQAIHQERIFHGYRHSLQEGYTHTQAHEALHIQKNAR